VKKIIIGNWKMYVEKPEEAKQFLAVLKRKIKNISGTEAWIAPPFPMLPTLAAAAKNSPIKIGAQAVSPFDEPMHTGDVSAKMVKAAGASFAIVGHSERRAIGETNEMVRAEMQHALAAGLTAVLCIGEKERDPHGAHFNFVVEQLNSALIGIDKKYFSRIVVAYEPVWAIGKHAADAMQPAQLEEMVIFIRKTLADALERSLAQKIPILYGGSVEAENVKSLLRETGINGFLVGHASAGVDSFSSIILSCQK
jgi:triosephosphate isomerase